MTERYKDNIPIEGDNHLKTLNMLGARQSYDSFKT